jgi:hypothetical protein
MQKFPPSGIRNGIDFVEYWRNGSTPRRDRWTRRVVTVEHATITVQVAPRILTHSRILANKTYDLCRGRLNRFSDLRTDGRSSGKCFSLPGLAAPVSRSCPLETKDEYQVLEVGPGKFRSNYIIYQYLTRLTAFLEAAARWPPHV